MAAVRPVLAVFIAILADILVAANGTQLRAVESTAPWGAPAQQEDRGWTWKLPQAAMSVMKECLSSSSIKDTGACIRTVASRALDRVARTQREINLGAGLMLVPDAKEATSRSVRKLPEEATVPEAAESAASSASSADEALSQRVLSFLQGYSLRVQLPSARTLREAVEAPPAPPSPPANDTADFLGRKSKGNGGLAPLLVFGSSLLPVKMSILALLVGKALMLSTLAFAIPALRLLQGGGMGGGGGGGGGGHHCH